MTTGLMLVQQVCLMLQLVIEEWGDFSIASQCGPFLTEVDRCAVVIAQQEMI